MSLLRFAVPISYLLLFSFHTTFAQKPITLKSPNGHLTFTFQLTRDTPTYKVDYKGTELIGESTLGLDFVEGGAFKRSAKNGDAQLLQRRGEL